MNTSNLSSEEIFNFPCDYPLKIFGKDHEQLNITVCSIIEKHTDKLHPNQIKTKHSSKGKYVSMTIRIIASSRPQLDLIYKDLQDCPLVAYVL